MDRFVHLSRACLLPVVGHCYVNIFAFRQRQVLAVFNLNRVYIDLGRVLPDKLGADARADGSNFLFDGS